MNISTVSQFLLKVMVTAGLVATLTACGGGGSGGGGNDQNTPSSQVASSHTSSSSVSSVSSRPDTSVLMGGAMQGSPLNIATVVSTFAGAARGANGIGTAARFDFPIAIVRDGANLFVADSGNHTIRKIDIATGAATTVAGRAGFSGTADGIGATARFNNPDGITTDGTNLYVTDGGSYTIRKIVIATGAVTTLAGAGGSGITTDGTNLYVTDNCIVRKIDIATGVATTFAGTAGVRGSADGTGAAASFFSPSDITTDGTNLYVADTGNNNIRKIEIATGVVTTLADSGASGITTDGTNLYVTNGYTISKIDIATGVVTTLAGPGTSGAGSVDGIGAAAQFSSPQGLTTDGTNLYVADTGNHTIRKLVIANGAVTTLAGATGISTDGSADGVGAAASFDRPYGITTDGTNLYVADTWNNIIRKIDIATGSVTTLAGKAGAIGSADGTGAEARFFDPSAITTDGTNLYVADSSNYTIRKIVIATGAVTTIAGTAGAWGTADGTGTAARFSMYYGITTDGTNLYVADSNNYTIRKIVIATGAVTTLAGTAGARGSADGIGPAAIFYLPQGITTDGTNLYVADMSGIRKIVISTGAVTTIPAGACDGVTTDGTNLYVTDNDIIRKIVIATGDITTLAGTAGVTGSADGIGAAASFGGPYDITTDGFDLFVADPLNNTIRKIH